LKLNQNKKQLQYTQKYKKEGKEIMKRGKEIMKGRIPIWALIVFGMFFASGCATINGTSNLDIDALAHDAGYAATAVYFYQKNKGEGEDYIEAAELAYDVLTFIVEEDEEIAVEIEDYVIKLVSERTDNPDTRIASTALVRLYGKRLRSRLNWEGLSNDARMDTLKHFYSGIKDAIEDLDPILGDNASVDVYHGGEMYSYLYSDENGETSTYVLDCGKCGTVCSGSCGVLEMAFLQSNHGGKGHICTSNCLSE
jgi:hypothetical protein